jgi:hypothetical protein
MAALLEPQPAPEVLCNCRVKVYPDGTIGEVLVCSLPTFRPPGWELVDKPVSMGTVAGCGNCTERARRRAQQRIRDLIACNSDLDVMWTLTLREDAETETGRAIGRTDYAALNHKVQQWLADRVRRRGLRYVAVYEYHDKVETDGLHAIHVHGVSNHDALRMTDSGHRYRDKGGHWHRIYNLTDWRLGLTTGLYTYGSRWGAATYISKYIRKSDRPVGGRWYMHSHNLCEPHYEYLNVDYRSARGHTVYIPDAHCAYKYVPPIALDTLTMTD